MSSEEFIRYLSSIIAVGGLVLLAITVGQQFGLWAAGAILLACGAAIGVPLWNKHFDAMHTARISAAWRPEQPKKASEESPY